MREEKTFKRNDQTGKNARTASRSHLDKCVPVPGGYFKQSRAAQVLTVS